jgi:hypothetical protein
MSAQLRLSHPMGMMEALAYCNTYGTEQDACSASSNQKTASNEVNTTYDGGVLYSTLIICCQPTRNARVHGAT